MMTGGRQRRLLRWLSVCMILALLLPAGATATEMTTAPAAASASTNAGEVAAEPLTPEACIDNYTPENSGTTHDGADTLDKCVTQTFTSNGTTKRIVVFYTDTDNSSKHRASQQDAQDILDAAIDAWQAYVSQGFNEPRHDGGQGTNNGTSNDKDNRFDIWIEHDNGDGWWGIAWWYPTDHVSIHAPLARGDEGTDLQRDAVVYHELFHRVQYSYDFNEVKNNYSGNAWMVEGGARHMQDEVTTAVDNDANGRFRSAANNFLGQPHLDLRNRSYIAALWWKYMSEQLGENTGDPGLGTDAVETFWDKTLVANEMTALDQAVQAEGLMTLNTFFEKFTTANYAKDYSSSDSSYDYVDDDTVSWNSVNLAENRSPGASGYYTVNYAQDPWAARYFQLNLTSSCQVVNYKFTSTSGDTLGFDVLTVSGSTLQDHWSTVGTSFNKSFINDGYSKAVGIVTTFQDSANYRVEFGCVTPTIEIERPQQLGAGSPALVGPHDAPNPFTVRLRVSAAGSASLEGLEASDFQVTVGGQAAGILGSAYVLDRYWLSIDTPTQTSDGVYDLEVELLSVATDTEPQSVLYSTLGQNDVVHVLDVSGSMFGDKIAAAKEAFKLLVNEVAIGDYGGLVKFSGDGSELEWDHPANGGSGWGAKNNDASTVFTLQEIPDDATRDALRSSVDPLVTENWTSIGDGLLQAVDEYNNNGSSDHLCTIILLSDGDENEGTLYQDDPEDPGGVADAINSAGCRVDTIAFGPQANEELMQIIAGAHSGDYYYAPDSGALAKRSASAPEAPAAIPWQNQLAQVFDYSINRAAGRQRMQSFYGVGEQGTYHMYYISKFDNLALFALKWLNPGAPGEVMYMRITDPDGKPLLPTGPGCSPLDYLDSHTERYCDETNEVVRIDRPKQGFWKVELGGRKPSDYVLMGSVGTDWRFELFAGEATAVFRPGSTTRPATVCRWWEW